MLFSKQSDYFTLGIMDSAFTLWTWMIRKPRSVDVQTMATEAMRCSWKMRFLAGASWFLLVVGSLVVGCVIGEQVSSRLDIIAFAVAVFLLISLSLVVTGAVLWIILMRSLDVPESLIKLILIRGPLVA